jgi:hypothetical protein
MLDLLDVETSVNVAYRIEIFRETERQLARSWKIGRVQVEGVKFEKANGK